MEKADRFNAGKPQWSILDFNSLEPLVRVMEYGVTKYSRDNWKKGLPRQEVCDSLMRHLIDYMNGKMVDDESGCATIGHILANAMFLSYGDINNICRDEEKKQKGSWTATINKLREESKQKQAKV